VLTDPAECGPVTLALPQDTQAEAFDYPAAFFEPRLHRVRRPRPMLTSWLSLRRCFARRSGRSSSPAAECSIPRPPPSSRCSPASTRFPSRRPRRARAAELGPPLAAGSIGVTGSSAANALAADADVVLCVGTRLADFTSGSRTMFSKAALIGLNVAAFDAHKHGAVASSPMPAKA